MYYGKALYQKNCYVFIQPKDYFSNNEMNSGNQLASDMLDSPDTGANWYIFMI